MKSSRSDVFASQTVMDQSYIKRESRPGCPGVLSRCTVQAASAAAHDLTGYSHHITLFMISGLPLKRFKSYIFQSYNCFKSSITLLNNYKTNVTTNKTASIKHKTFSYDNYYIVQNNFVLVLIVNIITITRNSTLIVE